MTNGLAAPSTKRETPPFCPPRIRAFRADLIGQIPRKPHDRASLQAFAAERTSELILAYCTWRMRFVPAKPRQVTFWPAGVSPWQLMEFGPRLEPLISIARAGGDLTPHLSNEAKTAGIVMPGARTGRRRADIDQVLVRDGLHHFHLGEPGKPDARSSALVFADVMEDEFRVVAISNHRAFTTGTPESLRFFEICRVYVANNIPVGQAFMANPVMCSGHLMVVRLFADRCEAEMEHRDVSLDDPSFIDQLYRAGPMRDGCLITKPDRPKLRWQFDDLRFGILDEQTMVFFCLFPFFTR